MHFKQLVVGCTSPAYPNNDYIMSVVDVEGNDLVRRDIQLQRFNIVYAGSSPGRLAQVGSYFYVPR